MKKTDILTQFFFLTIHPGFGCPLFSTIYQVAKILHDDTTLDKKSFGVSTSTQVGILNMIIENPYTYLKQDHVVNLKAVVSARLDKFSISIDKKNEIRETFAVLVDGILQSVVNK